MYSRQFRTITAAALAAFALLIITAPAPAQQDLRSPDARDAAAQAAAGQDLRSPDTRDAALISQGLMEQPTRTSAGIDPVPGPAAVPPPSGRFDWLDAAIGAAGALGLALIATGTMLAVRRRTRRDHPAVA